MQQRPSIALTFDDGVNYETTIPVLDVLEQHGVVASFFVCGQYVNEETKPILQRLHTMGCEVDNHSYSHPNMVELSEEDVLREVIETSRLVAEAIGEPPRFFRPPYIALDQSMFDTIPLPFIEGYGCRDWLDTVSVAERVDGILSNAKDGNVILLHDFAGNYQTVQAIGIAIPKLLSLGFEFVTVTQLFERKNVVPQVGNCKIYSNVKHPRVCKW